MCTYTFQANAQNFEFPLVLLDLAGTIDVTENNSNKAICFGQHGLLWPWSVFGSLSKLLEALAFGSGQHYNVMLPNTDQGQNRQCCPQK